MEPFFQDTWAIVSFCVMISTLVLSALLCLWMRFCYFPGGYKRSQVIDIGELALFNAVRAAEAKRLADGKKTSGDDIYYTEVEGDAAANGEGKTGAAEGGADWQSVGSDLEQGGAGNADLSSDGQRPSSSGTTVLKSALKGGRNSSAMSTGEITPAATSPASTEMTSNYAAY